MAYTLANLQTDIRNYTEVDSNVLSDSVLERIIKNAELKIHRAIDTDQSVFYATSKSTTSYFRESHIADTVT